MAHEASTENIVLRVLHRADYRNSVATPETPNSMNCKNPNEADQNPVWAKNISQRRLRWLRKQHPRMDIDKLWLRANESLSGLRRE